MKTGRMALKIRVGEMMELLDGIHGQGISKIFAASGIHGVIVHDIGSLRYALDILGDKISIEAITLESLEGEYELIRKCLLALVSHMAQITVSMAARHAVVDMYDCALHA
jgi:hypothetical protein